MPIPAQKKRCDGFTLIEVLVALIVLSIGLLGVGKMVMGSARANESAYLRSQATIMAYTILDNLRANRQAAILHNYDTAFTDAAADPGFSCIGFVNCPPANLALYDVFRWKTRLASIPAGAGQVATVAASSSAPTTVVISVRWDDAVAQATFGASADGVAAPMIVTLETVL